MVIVFIWIHCVPSVGRDKCCLVFQPFCHILVSNQIKCLGHFMQLLLSRGSLSEVFLGIPSSTGVEIPIFFKVRWEGAPFILTGVPVPMDIPLPLAIV
ncbi:hypothetical protein M758_UG240500 [Ceratodon purpureus]|nr:hypothetical protein M758_UG240500 [Ceratodon purpureus]